MTFAYRMRLTGNRAYSMVEMLVTVASIVALVTLLLPVLSKGKRNAMSAQCMSNLRQIGNAHGIAMVESKLDPSLADKLEHAGGDWPAYIYPRMNEEVLFCPESDSPHGSTPLNQFMIGVHEDGNSDKKGTMTNTSFSHVNYFMELDASRPWVKKLGWEQFQEFNDKMIREIGMDFETAIKNRGGFSSVSWDYWENHYRGFEPGEDPNRFVLFMEDYKLLENSNNKWYKNFLDFFIFVEPVEGNEREVNVRAMHGIKGSGDAGYLVWSDTKKPVHNPVKAMSLLDTRTVTISKDLGSYGVNPNQIFKRNRNDSRILFLDYEHVVATPENWDDWDDELGRPKFARHAQGTMNVLFVDGSVQMTTEDAIEPTIFSNEKNYW